MQRTRTLLPPPRDDTEARLLAAIDAQHDSDDPRSVYADWLLERGDPHGELFAVQAQLARGAGPWSTYVLERREEAILHTGYYTPVVYRRGVPDGVRLDPRDIKDELPAYLELMRWSTTTAEEYRAGIERLATHPQASNVVELDLEIAHENWTRLFHGALRPRRLVLPTSAVQYSWPKRGWMTSDDVALLRDAPMCEHVEQLQLSAAIDETGLAALVRAPWMSRVTSLASDGVVNYATAHGLGYQGRTNGPITDVGARLIASHLRALRRLDLRWNRITAEGVRALADSDLALDELRLSLDGLGVAGLEALAASRFAGIARVSTGVHRETEPAAYRALLESPLWAERWVDLWVDKTDDIGPIVDAIAAAGAAPIEELRIRGGALDGAQLERLLHCPAMRSLRHLALVEVTGDLRACTSRPLQTLVVVRCPLDIEAVLAGSHARGLEHLFLEDCELGDEGVRRLARSELRPVWLEVEDRTNLATYIELLGSPLLAKTERLRSFLRQQSSPFDTAPVKRVILESPYLSAIKSLSLQGLEAFSKEDKLEIKKRFGAGLRHP